MFVVLVLNAPTMAPRSLIPIACWYRPRECLRLVNLHCADAGKRRYSMNANNKANFLE